MQIAQIVPTGIEAWELKMSEHHQNRHDHQIGIIVITIYVVITTTTIIENHHHYKTLSLREKIIIIIIKPEGPQGLLIYLIRP